MTFPTMRDARLFGALAWLLTGLFLLRVSGQAVQRWWPQAALPAAEAFQGSNLPYPLLLGAQLVILGAMAYCAERMRRGELAPRRRLGAVLAWAGAAYMAVALARIALGLFWPAADPWFRAWIPASFHLVLASFVLLAARYHAHEGGKR